MAKKNPIFYTNRIVKLSECKEGDYVYNSEAKLCCVSRYIDDETGLPREGDTSLCLYSYGICSHVPQDMDVYPISILTDKIMERMRAMYEIAYNKKRYLDPYEREALERKLNYIMSLDIYDKDYNRKYFEFWENLEKYIMFSL